MPAVDLSHRSRRYELMDSPSVGYADMERCFRHIEMVNGLTGGYRPTLSWLAAMLRTVDRHSGRPVRILDIGCGSGDTLRRIWKWSRRRGLTVELTGVDINPHAGKIAQARTPANAPVSYVTTDIFTYKPATGFDFITSSLFMHHLNDSEIVRLLQWMSVHSREGWFINDLHRHWLPYYFIKYAVSIARFDPMVRHDAPVSVARAFTAHEWAHFLAEAGLSKDDISIHWYFPFRYGVVWRSPRK